MAEDPDMIRGQIEQTRREMGDTVEALSYKADVKSRAKDAVSEKKDALMGKVSGSTPDAGDVKQGARKAKGIAQENPLGLAVAGVAVGFLIGTLIPSTPVEDEKLGPLADDVKEQAKQTGQEALERGKDVAQSAAQSAVETAKDQGQEHGQQLAANAQENAQQVGSS
jgi:ElaB/YqjD/DUF883 family membrane-anchored ribosome-binding protein